MYIFFNVFFHFDINVDVRVRPKCLTLVSLINWISDGGTVLKIVTGVELRLIVYI